ncbi:hypothetical protein Tco_0513704 [Tanacetum coccineum]
MNYNPRWHSLVKPLTMRFSNLFLKKKNFLVQISSIGIAIRGLEHPIPVAPVLVNPGQQIPVDVLAAHTHWVKASKKITCLMLVSMTPDLQKTLEHFAAYDIL